MKQIVDDMLSFSPVGFGTFRVWQRNFLYFRYKVVSSFFWIIFEPSLYLLAFGKGLGNLVAPIGKQSYLAFLFPALLANTAMMVAFFECSYGSFTRLTHQKTYSTIMLSPLLPSEIAFGDLIWGTSKGLFSVFGVAVVGSFMGLVQSWLFLWACLILLLICFLFAALGLVVASYARDYDSFIYATSGFIIPMTLISGTYFPLSELPFYLQYLAWLLPLTHGVAAVRQVLAGNVDGWTVMNLGILLIMAVLVTNWGVRRIDRRIFS